MGHKDFSSAYGTVFWRGPAGKRKFPTRCRKRKIFLSPASKGGNPHGPFSPPANGGSGIRARISEIRAQSVGKKRSSPARTQQGISKSLMLYFLSQIPAPWVFSLPGAADHFPTLILSSSISPSLAAWSAILPRALSCSSLS